MAKSKIDRYISQRLTDGKNTFVLCGGRRSGKTYGILTFLLLTGAFRKIVVNIASMTAEQGRLGAYADMKDIIATHPATFAGYEVFSNPREIRGCNGTRIFFNSYQNSETAKGIACDYLFLNEANNFTKQQYTDLLANVRRGVFLDYNPNIEFWVSDYFDESDICHTTWRDNPFLTDLQLQYFADLKRLAERPNASAIDIRNYQVYYEGNYCELKGDIFNVGNIRFVDDLPNEHGAFEMFIDPSALRGADYLAGVIGCSVGQDIYIVDSISVNGAEGATRASVCKWIADKVVEYGLQAFYVETNGLVGLDFFDFCTNSDLPVSGWYSKGNKFERIIAQYGNITERVHFLDNERNREYVQQIYEFGEKCEHDDNADALASFVSLQTIV